MFDVRIYSSGAAFALPLFSRHPPGLLRPAADKSALPQKR
jgi:hypothetical protein